MQFEIRVQQCNTGEFNAMVRCNNMGWQYEFVPEDWYYFFRVKGEVQVQWSEDSVALVLYMGLCKYHGG